MRKMLLAAALGSVMATGSVAAQPAPDAPPPPRADRPMGDGVLTRDEATARADRQFDRLDFNRDGRISEETFAAAGKMGGPRGKGPGRRGRGPGMARGADAPPPPPPAAMAARPDRQARVAQRFRALDRNNDGQLTRDEFRVQAMERFARVDANRDGAIDAAERFANREKMREQRRGAAPAAPRS